MKGWVKENVLCDEKLSCVRERVMTYRRAGYRLKKFSLNAECFGGTYKVKSSDDESP